LACASSSVGAVITVISEKNLIERGSRPSSAAAARVAATDRARISGRVAVVKMPSACAAANFRPRGDAPAWKITGLRCGDGSVSPMPGTSKYCPWCSIACTLAGSAYTPAALSTTTASSSHEDSHSL
jgi:hypothetical protein